MIFVQHETDMIQYIKNSLYPCPQISIREVIYRRDAQKMNVKVAEKYLALCLGKGETNIPR